MTSEIRSAATTTRPVVPAALLVVAVIALAAGVAPDAAFAGVVTGVLRRALKPETLGDWHRLQHSSLSAAAIAAALGALGVSQWRRIDPLLDRIGAALGMPEHDWRFDLGAVFVAMLVLQGASLLHGQLRGDDYIFLREGRLPLAGTILQPWGGHVFPLWRAESAALTRLWGSSSVAFRWWLFANLALLAFVQARVLAAWGLSRGARLVAIVVFCGWTQWAQVTMGYWTLSMTVKVWIATSIAVLAVIGDEQPGALRRMIVLLAGLAAVLEDSTGAIVAPALVVAAAACGWRNGEKGRALLRRVEWPAAVALICAVAFTLGQWLVHLEAMVFLPGVARSSFIDEALYLLGVGTTGTLLAPVVTTQLSPHLASVLSVVLSAGIALAVWRLWQRATRDQRAPLGFGVAMLVFGLVMIVGARPYPDYYFMVGWTHYMAFLYIPVVTIVAVAWEQARRARAWRPAIELQYLALGCTVFLAAQAAGSRLADRMLLQGGLKWEQRDALDRRAMISQLRDSLFIPLAAIVPNGGHVPEMLSTALDVRFPVLQPLFPLSFYDEAAGVSRGRFRWVAGRYANGETSDASDVTVVTHMKGVVDPAFRSALHMPSWWRDTYFTSTPLDPTPTDAVACAALRRGARPMRGDADGRHWLMLDVGAVATAGPPTVVSVAFKTGFRARAVYQVSVPAETKGCARVELLNLPELVLSDSVELLGLENKSPRRVELLGLFPPARR